MRFNFFLLFNVTFHSIITTFTEQFCHRFVAVLFQNLYIVPGLVQAVVKLSWLENAYRPLFFG